MENCEGQNKIKLLWQYEGKIEQINNYNIIYVFGG